MSRPDAARPAGTSRESGSAVAEARWPMAGAIVAAMVLTVLLPGALRLGPSWLLPCIEGVLLVAIVLGDGDRIDRRSTFLRVLSISLVSVLVFEAMWSTAWLIHALVEAESVTNSASDLLLAGANVWVANNIAFALLYWEIDGGGPPPGRTASPRTPTSPSPSS
jgi:hypothetical protein